MKMFEICAAVALIVMVVAIWACCKMSRDCDKREEQEDAEVVHGAWEPHPYHPGLVRCSKCKEQIIPEDMADEEIYCSKCGTKLGGK